MTQYQTTCFEGKDDGFHKPPIKCMCLKLWNLLNSI